MIDVSQHQRMDFQMRTPIYRSRPVDPTPARFGRCERINDFVVMSEGFSNVYLLETAGASVLVNSGMGMEAPVHHRNLSSHSDAPIGHLIFTQGHVDHVGGTAFFRELYPGLQVIAQSGNPEHQSYENRLAWFRARRAGFAFDDEFAAINREYRDHGYTDFNPQDAPTPDVLFDDRLELNVGGLDVVLIGCPGAETNDSLIVWLPQHRICLTGNLFGCPFGHFPNLSTIRGDRYRDALVCAQAAQTVLDLAPAMILYGHHAPVVGQDVIEAELTAFRDGTLYVHDETVKGMNQGKDVRTLMREITLPPELELGEGYGKVSWGVRSIWEHYSGWFHAESTTELYSVGPRSVDADLVDLAGADRIVERAGEKLAADLPEEALHLLDIVLGHHPDHARALELSRQTHQRLLEQSENMWLTRWLKHQLKLLDN